MLPILSKEDIYVSYEKLSVEKIDMRYDDYFNFGLFVDELELKCNLIVDYSNIDDLGFLIITFVYNPYRKFNEKLVMKTFLDTYKKYMSKYNKQINHD